MATANSLGNNNLVGAIQKYLERTLFAQKDFETPLANKAFGTTTNLPKGNGQTVEYRWIGDMDLPEEIGEGVDPADALALSTETVTKAIYEVAGFTDITNLLRATDWIDDFKKLKEALQVAFQRKAHLMAQVAMVVTSSRTVYGQTYTNTAFPAIYACNKPSFALLTAADYVTLADIKRAVSRLRNSRVPSYDGKYVAVVSEGIESTLMEDPGFADAVKRHMELVNKVDIPGHFLDWAGVRWVRQTEPYKVAIGGNGTTLDTTSPLEVCHIFGKNAFGRLEMGGEGGSMNAIKLKVQDITKTGCLTTLGTRVAFATSTLQTSHGVNLYGVNKYSESNG